MFNTHLLDFIEQGFFSQVHLMHVVQHLLLRCSLTSDTAIRQYLFNLRMSKQRLMLPLYRGFYGRRKCGGLGNCKTVVLERIVIVVSRQARWLGPLKVFFVHFINNFTQQTLIAASWFLSRFRFTSNFESWPTRSFQGHPLCSGSPLSCSGAIAAPLIASLLPRWFDLRKAHSQ